MIGEEDAIHLRNYSTSLKCNSYEGVLLSMKVNDFHQRIISNEETDKYICSSSTKKENGYIFACVDGGALIKKNEEISQKLA